MLPISSPNNALIANTTRIDRGDGFSIDPPTPRRTGEGASVELSPEVEQRLREINASPLMHLPRIDEEEAGPNLCTGPGALLWGVTPGSILQAISLEQAPPVFLLYGCNPETGAYEYTSTFLARPVTSGPINGFNSDIFSLTNWSVGGVATIRRFDDEERGGQTELGPGMTVGFEIPGPAGKNISGVFFANVRGFSEEFPDGIIPSDFTGGLALNAGIAISGGDIASLLLHSGGSALSGVPKPAVAGAGQTMIGASRLIDALTTHLADVKFGFGERVEARYENGQFIGIFYRGERIELEDLVAKLVEKMSGMDELPLIPDGGNPVIAQQNILTRLAFGEDPFSIAYELGDQPSENSAVQIAQRFNAFIENTMRPNAHLLSEGLQRRINLPLTSVNDFGPIYDAFVSQVEALGMGHLRDDIGLSNPYAITGGSYYLWHGNFAAYAHFQASGGVGELPVEEAIRLGILPRDFLETRRQLLGQPEFDEHDPSHSPGGWIELFLRDRPTELPDF